MHDRIEIDPGVFRHMDRLRLLSALRRPNRPIARGAKTSTYEERLFTPQAMQRVAVAINPLKQIAQCNASQKCWPVTIVKQ